MELAAIQATVILAMVCDFAVVAAVQKNNNFINCWDNGNKQNALGSGETEFVAPTSREDINQPAPTSLPVGAYCGVIVNNLENEMCTVTASHKNNKFLPGRNTIVHLFEWKWDDIAVECENFLGPKGFAGVQSLEYVRQQVIDFLNHLVSLGVAGFRIDAAKHMWPEDLEVIYGRVDNLAVEHGFAEATRPFFYQEVIDLGGEAVSKYEYTSFGAVLDFKFGTELGNAFQGHNALKYLQNWGPEWGLLDSEYAVAFIDNHDNQRDDLQTAILTHKKPKPYKMAIAFMLAHPYGTTRIMSSYFFDSRDQGPPNNDGHIIGPGFTGGGTCTNGWVCEHRWRQIYNMVGFRNTVTGTTITNWWDNGDNQIAFGRGDKGFVAFTLRGDLNETLRTSLPTGTYCDVISGSLEGGICTGKYVDVDRQGCAFISLAEYEEDGVLAIHVNARL